ncbi:hypothetical protein ACHAQJ_002794 [Trichoderma viride]
MDILQDEELVTQVQVDTTSFILLHENNSSGREVSHAFKAGLQPVDIRGLLVDTHFFAPNAPFTTCEWHPDRKRRQYCWFTPTNLGDANDTAALYQWKQLSFSMNTLRRVIEQESRVVGRENVYVLGFGTGFAVAATYILQAEEPIGGLLGIRPWLPFHGDLKSIALYGKTVTALDQMPNQGGYGSGANDEPLSGASTPTLRADDDDAGATTSEAMLKRVAGFLDYLVLTGFPPMDRRILEHVDSSTPVILVHDMDDRRVGLVHAKEALETLRKFGFNASLDIMEGQGQGKALTREMFGNMLNEFMERGLGNDVLRAGIAEGLQSGDL